MFLNVLKGPYLVHHQVDAVLPVSGDEDGTIERGSCLYRDSDDEWQIAGAAQAGSATEPGAIVYFALQPGDDLVAQMAGSVPSSGNAVAAVGALACTQAMEVETDMFTGEPEIGDLLAVGADGRLVVHAHGQTAVARCTAAPHTRWSNNATAVAGWRTGANVTVIRATTAYVTGVATE